MKEVIFNGFIGDKYGRSWKIKVNKPSDILACVDANYPGFRQEMLEYAEAGGDIDIQCGDRLIESEDELLFNIPEDTIIITPVPAGAKSGGAKILLGALLVASLFIPGSSALLLGSGFISASGASAAASLIGTAGLAGAAGLNIAGLAIVGLGVSLALTGLMQIMAPDPSTDGTPDEEYLFNGPENTVAQNNIVPVLLGEMIVGGVIIASGTVSGLRNRGFTYVSTQGDFGTSFIHGGGGGGYNRTIGGF
jgi:predicted phage tail protein